jgi:hypothetical protein
MVTRNAIAAVEAQGKTLYRAGDYRQEADGRLTDGRLTELAERVRSEAASAGLSLPKLAELAEKLGASAADMKRAAVYLREQDDLRLLDGGLLFCRQAWKRLLALLASMDGDITVAALRDAAGVNRKTALAMLEFTDAQNITKRDGDRRTMTN